MSFFKDLASFILERKKFWLIPVIVFLLAALLVVFLAGSSAVSPLIYSLF